MRGLQCGLWPGVGVKWKSSYIVLSRLISYGHLPNWLPVIVTLLT